MRDEQDKSQYRQRAAELRAMARNTVSQLKRDAYLNMAQEYERLASGAPGFRLVG